MALFNNHIDIMIHPLNQSDITFTNLLNLIKKLKQIILLANFLQYKQFAQLAIKF